MIGALMIAAPMPRLALVFLVCSAVSHADAQTAPQVRPLIEELRIDGSQHDWKQVGAVRMGPAGHLLVGERLGKTIRVFSPDGRLLRSLGRYGDGPGEFRNASTFGILGDTIWVGDVGMRRLTFFDLSGNLLGTLRADSALQHDRDAKGSLVVTSRPVWSAPIVLYRGGTALITPMVFGSDADTLGSAIVFPLWRATWRGRVLDTATAVTLESPLVKVIARDGSRHNFIPNPFPQRQQAGTSVDGNRLVVVDAAFTGPNAWSYEVRMTDRTGRELYRRRFPFPRTPVPRHVVDSVADDLVNRYRNYSGVREAIPVPPSYPPVNRVLVANDGTVWLRGRDDPAGALWTILDPKGSPFAIVREPPRTRFSDLDGGLWAIERDADDVESIIRYRLGPG